MIYFDNAATTLVKPPEVSRAVMQALATFGGAGRGMHQASLAAAMSVYETREKIAKLFNASAPRRVAFTLNATEALNIVIEGLIKPGDRVLTTAASHNSVLRPLYRKREQGASLALVPVSSAGRMDYESLEYELAQGAKLLVLTHASNLTGDVYDVRHVGELCAAHNTLLVVDAAQTAGHFPLDMQELGIGIVVFTGHKGLFGPQGTGGLCVAEGIEIAPYKVGGSGTHSFDAHHPHLMPESLEAGTINSHGLAGLSAGLEYVESRGVENLQRSLESITERFRTGASSLKGVTIYGGAEACGNCGIVTLNLDGFDASQIADRLDADFGICTRAGAHCAPLMHEALGTAETGALRFSFSVFNTAEEVDFTLSVLEKITHEKA